jgi:hypothetical protein
LRLRACAISTSMNYAGAGKQFLGGQRPLTFLATSYCGWWPISFRPNASVTSMLRAGVSWTNLTPKQPGAAPGAGRFRNSARHHAWP